MTVENDLISLLTVSFTFFDIAQINLFKVVLKNKNFFFPMHSGSSLYLIRNRRYDILFSSTEALILKINHFFLQLNNLLLTLQQLLLQTSNNFRVITLLFFCRVRSELVSSDLRETVATQPCQSPVNIHVGRKSCGGLPPPQINLFKVVLKSLKNLVSLDCGTLLTYATRPSDKGGVENARARDLQRMSKNLAEAHEGNLPHCPANALTTVLMRERNENRVRPLL
eukprot:sb/3469652/